VGDFSDGLLGYAGGVERRPLAALSLALWAGLACATAAPPPPSPPPPPPEPVPSAPEVSPPRSKLLRPDQIFDILERSPIHYEIESEGPVAALGLAQVTELPVPSSRPVDAYVELRRDTAGGPRRVESRWPPPEIAELFGRAGEAFAAERWQEARTLYAAAAAAAPDYFKTYTYLGNTLNRLQAYDEAQESLQRALALNPVDYQAMLFLGDAYFETGQYARAKAILLRAYMLNRGSEAVEQRLDATLVKLDLKRRPPRLAPQFRIERTAEGQVNLHIDERHGARWLALAACMACWAYEDECRARSPEEDDPLRLAMYRECLVNQAASIAVRREQEPQEVLDDELQLLAAIEGGFLEAIIFWEVVGEAAPLVIYLLPDEVQAEIVRYIERFVLVSTRLI
jgi:tetratricopeptide (TPR) repeat protein